MHSNVKKYSHLNLYSDKGNKNTSFFFIINVNNINFLKHKLFFDLKQFKTPTFIKRRAFIQL